MKQRLYRRPFFRRIDIDERAHRRIDAGDLRFGHIAHSQTRQKRPYAQLAGSEHLLDDGPYGDRGRAWSCVSESAAQPHPTGARLPPVSRTCASSRHRCIDQRHVQPITAAQPGQVASPAAMPASGPEPGQASLRNARPPPALRRRLGHSTTTSFRRKAQASMTCEKASCRRHVRRFCITQARPPALTTSVAVSIARCPSGDSHLRIRHQKSRGKGELAPVGRLASA